MCGIIAIAAQSNIVPELLYGLGKLEYRGYDSAGIAVVENGKINTCKAVGQLHNLEKKLQTRIINANHGIAHTRWATHGKIEERNCHPIINYKQNGKIAIVHNGIIENFQELKKIAHKQLYQFVSDTDTEVCIAHIIIALKQGASMEKAFLQTIDKIQGYYSLALINLDEPEKIYAARFGCPLCLGEAKNKNMLASDAIALSTETEKISYLEDGDIVIMTSQNVTITDKNNKSITRKKYPRKKYQKYQKYPWVAPDNTNLKGNYQHYMLKEIHEQPEIATHVVGKYINLNDGKIQMPSLKFSIKEIKNIVICGCGTAYYAGLTAKYWIEKYTKIKVTVETGSELRSSEMITGENCIGLFVSQSGETLDTLLALREFKKRDIPTIAVVNVPMSTIMREADYTMQTYAGYEIGVASTKAMFAQLAVLAIFAAHSGYIRKTINADKYKELINEISNLPRLLRDVLAHEKDIAKFSKKLSKRKNAIFIGRNITYPLALEGALKLKEISYIHAEGYRAGELKHGPLALVDEDMPVIAIAPSEIVFQKMMSNIQEVVARGAQLVFISDKEPIDDFAENLIFNIKMPKTSFLQTPFAYLPILQMLAYYCAVSLGTDVDQPRNLAKSVTVE